METIDSIVLETDNEDSKAFANDIIKKVLLSSEDKELKKIFYLLNSMIKCGSNKYVFNSIINNIKNGRISDLISFLEYIFHNCESDNSFIGELETILGLIYPVKAYKTQGNILYQNLLKNVLLKTNLHSYWKEFTFPYLLHLNKKYQITNESQITSLFINQLDELFKAIDINYYNIHEYLSTLINYKLLPITKIKKYTIKLLEYGVEYNMYFPNKLFMLVEPVDYDVYFNFNKNDLPWIVELLYEKGFIDEGNKTEFLNKFQTNK